MFLDKGRCVFGSGEVCFWIREVYVWIRGFVCLDKENYMFG